MKQDYPVAILVQIPRYTASASHHGFEKNLSQMFWLKLSVVDLTLRG